jgi:hypothetical protein
MKKFQILLFLLTGLLLVSACTKSTELPPMDYRNNITGDWRFEVGLSSFNHSTGSSTYDTVIYTGKIIKGPKADEILIKYTKTDSIILTLDMYYMLGNFPTIYCSGDFKSMNRLSLYLRWGGLGGGIIHDLDGEKL